MPLDYGQVQIGAFTIRVEPFPWPAVPIRVGIHETAGGRIPEVDDTGYPTDVDLELQGTERHGWADMTDAMKANFEAQWQAGDPVIVQDWRANSGSFLHREAPEFQPAATDDTMSPPGTYWTFRFRFIRTA